MITSQNTDPFRSALALQNKGRPPVWFMRQAGRYHQHYQNLKKDYSFMDLCKIPTISAEAAMGPIQDFDFDAAILFSDILFPLEVLGMGLSYDVGPKLDWHLRTVSDLSRLKAPTKNSSALEFQSQAIQQLRKRLPQEKGLIGFVGGPLTLFFYAVAGSHKGDLSDAKLAITDGRWSGFVDHLIPMLAENMALQARSGADTIAVLDTCAGEIEFETFQSVNVPILRSLFQKFRELCPETPITYYSKKTDARHIRCLLNELPTSIRPAVFGVDWNVSLANILDEFGETVGIQGNIDPDWLFLPTEELSKRVTEVLKSVYALPPKKRQGWVFGLGHGILPKTPEKNVKFLVQMSREFHDKNSPYEKNSPAVESLIHKYNVPGPRYTSYPTVPYWDQSPTETEWITSLSNEFDRAKNSNDSQGAALYLHIPYCKSLCTYCGCNTRITRKNDVGLPYVQTLLKEFNLYRSKLGIQTLPISELHLGGGTPTFLTPDELKQLVDPILSLSKVSNEYEFSIEADPRVTTKEHLNTLRELGFRRLSLGIQDFDIKVQEAVNRVQTEQEVQIIVDHARSIGFTSINFDLIYGLPFQTLSSIEKTFEAVKRLRPDRIAFYGYAHVPWIKPSQRKFTEADLPEGEPKRSLYEAGRRFLELDGYQEIGMDHFAIESDSLWKANKEKTLHRNFMGYTSRRVTPLIGLGVSAIGDAWTAFAQNEKLLEKYMDLVHADRIPIFRGHLLSSEDLERRRVILDLMTRFETHFNMEPAVTFSEFVHDQLMSVSGKHILINEKGRPFLRNICMAIDAKLRASQPQSKLFSKTI